MTQRGRPGDDRRDRPVGEPPVPRPAAPGAAVAGGDRERRARAGGRSAWRAAASRWRCRCSCGRRRRRRGVQRGRSPPRSQQALDQARERGLVDGHADAGRPAAASAGADDSRAADRSRRGGAATSWPRRPRRRRARRWPTSTRCASAKAVTCAPTSTSAGRSSRDLVERVAVAADEGRAAMEARLRERVRELSARAAGRRDRWSRRRSCAALRDPTSARKSRASAAMSRTG